MNFNEVSTFGEKSGKCVVCGKTTKRREKFFQTLSPFNKNKEGDLKTREEIHDELQIERKDWLEKPLKHVKCE